MRLPSVAAKSLVLLAAALAGGCSEPGLEPLPPPRLPSGAIALRVAHAVNPRLERLAPHEIGALLAETARVSRAQFGVELRFEPVAELPIADLFRAIPPYVIEQRRAEIHDFKQGNGDREKLGAAVLQFVKSNPTGLEVLADYVRPYLDRPMRDASREALARALTETQLARLARWAGIRAPDGRPLLDAAPYNEWIYWDSLGYGGLAYDLVLTNQPVISAEYDSGDIHSALRGGLTVGSTGYARNGRYGAYVFWSSFPFVSTSEPATELRGGRQYAREEAVRLAGAYLAHEIGHLLYHYGHPFGEPACVMNPVPLLRFAETVAQLDAARCAQSARPEMKPGAAPLYYHRGWAQRALP